MLLQCEYEIDGFINVLIIFNMMIFEALFEIMSFIEQGLQPIKLIVLFAAFALSIVNLVWIYKANHNALDEPNNRLNYYSFEDAIIGPDDFYSSGEFCYEHYQPFLDIGALEDLDIKMKKIKKFSLRLI